MEKLFSFILVAGMASTFFVLANQSQNQLLQFLGNVWGVFLCIALIRQLMKGN
jgi:hypothetical protein